MYLRRLEIWVEDDNWLCCVDKWLLTKIGANIGGWKQREFQKSEVLKMIKIYWNMLNNVHYRYGRGLRKWVAQEFGMEIRVGIDWPV